MLFFEDMGFATLAVIAVTALLTSAVHGATGVAGGFLMAAVLASVIGVKPVVPVMSVALLISHSSRALMNFGDFDRKVFLAIAVPALPCIVAAALLYGKMSSSLIGIVLGVVVLTSIPIRRWAKSHKIKAGTGSLSAAGAVYGLLSGVSVGPGMLLIPFMLGYGLAKEAFVATLAVIALMANVVRLTVYSSSSLLDTQYLLLGIVVGLLTIPGNWVGRTILRKMTNENHADFVDVLTVIGAMNFIWLALR